MNNEEIRARNIRLEPEKWQALKLEAFKRGLFLKDYIAQVLTKEVERIKETK